MLSLALEAPLLLAVAAGPVCSAMGLMLLMVGTMPAQEESCGGAMGIPSVSERREVELLAEWQASAQGPGALLAAGGTSSSSAMPLLCPPAGCAPPCPQIPAPPHPPAAPAAQEFEAVRQASAGLHCHTQPTPAHIISSDRRHPSQDMICSCSPVLAPSAAGCPGPTAPAAAAPRRRPAPAAEAAPAAGGPATRAGQESGSTFCLLYPPRQDSRLLA